MKITGDKGSKSLIRVANIFSHVIILLIVQIKKTPHSAAFRLLANVISWNFARWRCAYRAYVYDVTC